MTSTIATSELEPVATEQQRPSGAKLRPAISLRLRLALLVALSVATVIGIEAFLEIRVFERTVEHDLLDTARITAHVLADDYELRGDPVDVDALSADLHELVISAPTLRTLTIVQVSRDTPTVVASTSTGERPEAIALGVSAIRAASTMSDTVSPGAMAVAVPLVRADGTRAAAVATVSLGALQQLRTKGRQVTLWFTPAAIVVLTLLVDWLGRRLIHRPIGLIRDTMARAGAGDFAARTKQSRPDEIGSVAAGLNDMLQRLQDFHEALQERVNEATAELRLRNAEQVAAVGQTAASVAHQVGTPLNLISGYVQMLQEDASVDPKTARRLQIVQEQIAKVTSVVRSVLDHSRRPGNRASIALGPVLTRVADVARPKLDASRIALKLDVPDSLPPIWADSEELELAILNLVTNSLDAMPQGGTLTIGATASETGVRVEVSDTGSGIPKELLPRIFDPWVTTKSAGHGTGLGLSITHDVIARHGGTIVAASDPGRETLFIIELPSALAAETVDVQNTDR